ncbi:M12 family metallopeptidase [Myxococcota bacterium]|nr:M12 family metallopeptidase [Myxococcota bacterium]
MKIICHPLTRIATAALLSLACGEANDDPDLQDVEETAPAGRDGPAERELPDDIAVVPPSDTGTAPRTTAEGAPEPFHGKGERPADPSDGRAYKGYPLMGRLWEPHVIPVCWESFDADDRDEREWVRDAVVGTWGAVADIHFIGWNSCTSASGGIRIAVWDNHDDGPSSYLGTVLDGRIAGVDLNFTFNHWTPHPEWIPNCLGDREGCIRAIAVHEFGHALGLAHEHNRPDTPDTCEMAPQGPDGDRMLYAWDPDSIMNYCTDISDGQLSVGDVETIQTLYGGVHEGRSYTPYVGGPGGVRGEQDCLPGYVAVGTVQSPTAGGSYVGQFGLVCARRADVQAARRLRNADMHVRVTQYFDPTTGRTFPRGWMPLNNHAAASPAGSQRFMCQTGEALQGVNVRSGGLIDQIASLRCVNLSSGSNRTVTVRIGGDGGSLGSLSCPRGTTVDAMFHRDAANLDGLALRCQR